MIFASSHTPYSEVSEEIPGFAAKWGIIFWGGVYIILASNILENAAAPTPVTLSHLRASWPLASWCLVHSNQIYLLLN